MDDSTNPMKTGDEPQLTDVKELRARARAEVSSGAVTPSYGADPEVVCELLNGALFYSLALKMRKAEDRKGIEDKDFLILVPAFVVSELKEAFQIGFLLFVPFIVIDIVVANILLALGMQMLSPTTISMPFKLLLFVMIDGWYLISKGLVVGYL